MKKIIALILSLAMLLGCTAALAETAQRESMGNLKVKDAFNIMYKPMEGYDMIVENETDTEIYALFQAKDAKEDDDRPLMLLTIAYDDENSNVGRLNDLSAEEKDFLKDIWFIEYEDYDLEVRETAYGTELWVVREKDEELDIMAANILTLYRGYMIEFYLISTADSLQEEYLQKAIDFLSDMDFVPVTAKTTEKTRDRGPETKDGPAFKVYGEDGSVAEIYPVVGGYYMDSRDSYDKTSDGLYVNVNTLMLYSKDPDFWKGYKGPETQVGDAFKVYGEDATTAEIFPVAGGYYKDAANNSYDLTSDGLYCDHETGMLYSPDPDYWKVPEEEPEEDRGPETKVGDAFLVYGEDATTVEIYPVAGDYFMDANGNAYDPTSDGLYSRHETGMLYSPNPDYWKAPEEEKPEEDRGPETKVGDAFIVYGEDATSVSIYPVAGGYYMDANGNAYDPTSDGLYTRHTTGMLYSPNPNYWTVEEADEEEAEGAPEPEERIDDLVEEEAEGAPEPEERIDDLAEEAVDSVPDPDAGIGE